MGHQKTCKVALLSNVDVQLFVKKQIEKKYNKKQQNERKKYILSTCTSTTVGNKRWQSLGIRKSKYPSAKKQRGHVRKSNYKLGSMDTTWDTNKFATTWR